jgi:ABC-2 type transport system ATP-binding protein
MVRDKIAYMSSEGGKTIFLCTHNLVEAESLCSRVAIIKSGKIIMIGSPGELGSDEEVSYFVRLERSDREFAKYIRGLEFVMTTEKVDGSLRVVLKSASSAPDLVEEIVKRGGRILDYRRETRTLEDIYLEAVQ